MWCGVNGVGLALVIPCVQSLTADYYPPESRGQAFGFMYFTSSLGESCRNPKPYSPHRGQAFGFMYFASSLGEPCRKPKTLNIKP